MSDLADQAARYLELGSHPCEVEGCSNEVFGEVSLCPDCCSTREWLVMTECAAEVPYGQTVSRAELVARWLEALPD